VGFERPISKIIKKNKNRGLLDGKKKFYMCGCVFREIKDVDYLFFFFFFFFIITILEETIKFSCCKVDQSTPA